MPLPILLTAFQIDAHNVPTWMSTRHDRSDRDETHSFSKSNRGDISPIPRSTQVDTSLDEFYEFSPNVHPRDDISPFVRSQTPPRRLFAESDHLLHSHPLHSSSYAAMGGDVEILRKPVERFQLSHVSSSFTRKIAELTAVLTQRAESPSQSSLEFRSVLHESVTERAHSPSSPKRQELPSRIPPPRVLWSSSPAQPAPVSMHVTHTQLGLATDSFTPSIRGRTSSTTRRLSPPSATAYAVDSARNSASLRPTRTRSRSRTSAHTQSSATIHSLSLAATTGTGMQVDEGLQVHAMDEAAEAEDVAGVEETSLVYSADGLLMSSRNTLSAVSPGMQRTARARSQSRGRPVSDLSANSITTGGEGHAEDQGLAWTAGQDTGSVSLGNPRATNALGGGSPEQHPRRMLTAGADARARVRSGVNLVTGEAPLPPIGSLLGVGTLGKRALGGIPVHTRMGAEMLRFTLPTPAIEERHQSRRGGLGSDGQDDALGGFMEGEGDVRGHTRVRLDFSVADAFTQSVSMHAHSQPATVPEFVAAVDHAVVDHELDTRVGSESTSAGRREGEPNTGPGLHSGADGERGTGSVGALQDEAGGAGASTGQGPWPWVDAQLTQQPAPTTRGRPGHQIPEASTTPSSTVLSNPTLLALAPAPSLLSIANADTPSTRDTQEVALANTRVVRAAAAVATAVARMEAEEANVNASVIATASTTPPSAPTPPPDALVDATAHLTPRPRMQVSPAPASQNSHLSHPSYSLLAAVPSTHVFVDDSRTQTHVHTHTPARELVPPRAHPLAHDASAVAVRSQRDRSASPLSPRSAALLAARARTKPLTHAFAPPTLSSETTATQTPGTPRAPQPAQSGVPTSNTPSPPPSAPPHPAYMRLRRHLPSHAHDTPSSHPHAASASSDSLSFSLSFLPTPAPTSEPVLGSTPTPALATAPVPPPVSADARNTSSRAPSSQSTVQQPAHPTATTTNASTPRITAMPPVPGHARATATATPAASPAAALTSTTAMRLMAALLTPPPMHELALPSSSVLVPFSPLDDTHDNYRGDNRAYRGDADDETREATDTDTDTYTADETDMDTSFATDTTIDITGDTATDAVVEVSADTDVDTAGADTDADMSGREWPGDVPARAHTVTPSPTTATAATVAGGGSGGVSVRAQRRTASLLSSPERSLPPLPRATVTGEGESEAEGDAATEVEKVENEVEAGALGISVGASYITQSTTNASRPTDPCAPAQATLAPAQLHPSSHHAAYTSSTPLPPAPPADSEPSFVTPPPSFALLTPAQERAFADMLRLHGTPHAPPHAYAQAHTPAQTLSTASPGYAFASPLGASLPHPDTMSGTSTSHAMGHTVSSPATAMHGARFDYDAQPSTNADAVAPLPDDTVALVLADAATEAAAFESFLARRAAGQGARRSSSGSVWGHDASAFIDDLRDSDGHGVSMRAHMLPDASLEVSVISGGDFATAPLERSFGEFPADVVFVEDDIPDFSRVPSRHTPTHAQDAQAAVASPILPPSASAPILPPSRQTAPPRMHAAPPLPSAPLRASPSTSPSPRHARARAETARISTLAPAPTPSRGPSRWDRSGWEDDLSPARPVPPAAPLPPSPVGRGPRATSSLSATSREHTYTRLPSRSPPSRASPLPLRPAHRMSHPSPPHTRLPSPPARVPPTPPRAPPSLSIPPLSPLRLPVRPAPPPAPPASGVPPTPSPPHPLPQSLPRPSAHSSITTATTAPPAAAVAATVPRSAWLHWRPLPHIHVSSLRARGLKLIHRHIRIIAKPQQMPTDISPVLARALAEVLQTFARPLVPTPDFPAPFVTRGKSKSSALGGAQGVPLLAHAAHLMQPRAPTLPLPPPPCVCAITRSMGVASGATLPQNTVYHHQDAHDLTVAMTIEPSPRCPIVGQCTCAQQPRVGGTDETTCGNCMSKCTACGWEHGLINDPTFLADRIWRKLRELIGDKIAEIRVIQILPQL